MLVEDKRTEKFCSFFVSEFHLEMILMPYINKKIEEKEKIVILTEKNLEKTVKELISKVNLKEENKQKILNLGWNKNKVDNIKNNSNIIIIGTKDYIERTNQNIENMNINKINVVDCYDFEEVKEEMSEIIKTHDKSLNTLGIKENLD